MSNQTPTGIYKRSIPTLDDIRARAAPPKCNRGVCQILLSPGGVFFNHGNGCLYCERCAGMINEYNPELCERVTRG